MSAYWAARRNLCLPLGCMSAAMLHDVEELGGYFFGTRGVPGLGAVGISPSTSKKQHKNQRDACFEYGKFCTTAWTRKASRTPPSEWYQASVQTSSPEHARHLRPAGFEPWLPHKFRQWLTALTPALPLNRRLRRPAQPLTRAAFFLRLCAAPAKARGGLSKAHRNLDAPATRNRVRACATRTT